MMTLSTTQHGILAAAARHPERLAYPSARLPAGARQTVANALLRQGLVIAIPAATHDATAVRTVDAESVVLQITQQGLDALALTTTEAPELETERSLVPPSAAEALTARPHRDGVGNAASTRQGLRDAAHALLTAWDACPVLDTTDNSISRAVEVLRTVAQSRRQARLAGTPGTPRHGTKQEAVLTLLRRPEGATIAQVMEATGWQQHTVRGFFAGLKRRQGITVTVLERVRQVGPGAQGSRGSHSIYAVVL